MHIEYAHIVPDSTYFNMIANSLDKVWPFAGVLDLIPHLGLFCLYVCSLEAVRVQFRQLECREVHSLFNLMTMEKDAQTTMTI